MKPLSRHLGDYLRLRRQLGFKFYVEGSFLRSFVRFARERGARQECLRYFRSRSPTAETRRRERRQCRCNPCREQHFGLQALK